jgi:hypothetical protein
LAGTGTRAAAVVVVVVVVAVVVSEVEQVKRGYQYMY